MADNANQHSPDSLFCFEDGWDAELYAAWYPERAEQLFTLEALAQLLAEGTVPTESERLEGLEKLFPERTPEYQRQLLTTIDRVRSAWVLQAQDIDYLFDQLPATPKNASLRREIHLYSDSPLSQDATHRLWQTRERLRSPQGTEWDREVAFVASELRGPLFEEIAKSFPRREFQGPEVIELSDFAPTPAHRPYVWQAEAALAIDRLAEVIQRRHRRAPQLRFAIAFSGSDSERAALKLALAAYRLPVEDWLATPRPPEKDALAFIRRSTLDNELKLRLGRLAFQERALVQSHHWTADQQFDRWAARGEITPSQRSALVAPAPVSASSRRLGAVTLLPFRDYRAPAGTVLFAYAGASLYQVDGPEGLLTGDEIENLRLKGLPIRSPSDRIARREQTLRSLAAHGPRIFSSLSAERLEGLRLIRLSRPPTVAVAPPPELSALRFDRSTFSATGLENFAVCPQRFLFAQRLRLRRESPDPQDRFALIYGQVVHRALERGWQSQPQQFDDLGWWTLHFEAALEELFPQTSPAQRVLLREPFKKMARHLPRMERELLSLRGPGKPIAFEKEFQLSYGGDTLRGFIDRIDETESGDLLVLDYKTGTVDFSPNHIQAGTHFQALVYWLAVERSLNRRCMGVVFYDLKRCELKRGFVRAEAVSAAAKKMLTRGHALEAARFDAITEAGVSAMEGLMSLAREGTFAATPEASACERCDYPTLCRRADGYR